MKYKMEIYHIKKDSGFSREYAISFENQIYWFYKLNDLDFYCSVRHYSNILILAKVYNKILTLNTEETTITKYNLNSILNEIKEVIPEHFV